MCIFSSYRRLLSLPGFGSSLVAAIAGKLQPGIFSLALFLDVMHYRTLSQAAAVVSVSALAGITVPLRGRLMDQYGYARVMWPALVLYLIALIGVMLNERAHGSLIMTVICALAAGVSAPPIQIVTRLMWRSIATDDLRTTVLSLDAVLADIGFIIGPTLAVILVELVAPWAGLAAAALLSAGATILLLCRRLPHQRHSQRSVERDWMGPLRSVALRHTMVAAVLFFFAVRAIELALPAWAQEHDSSLMSGVLLSSMAIGSVIGGLVLGALPPRWAGRAKLSVTLMALSLGTILAAFATASYLSVLVVAAAVMGLALGPSFVSLYTIAGDLSPQNMAVETQSWISSFMSLGGAAGAAISGLVFQTFGSGMMLAIAAASIATASVPARMASTK